MRGRSLILGVAAVAAAGTLTACSGPVDLTVVNPCAADVVVQTYDGSRDEGGRWRPDDEALSEFVVPARSEHTERDALEFVTAPEEIRLVAPVEASYLISITDDLDDDNTWTIPTGYCGRIDS